MDNEALLLLQYLASTDWYVVRKAETGEAVPQAILDARVAARIRISEIREQNENV